MLRDIAQLFFPDSCRGCKGGLRAGEHMFCTACISELSEDLAQGRKITDWLVTVPGLAEGWILLGFRQGGIVQNILHELKYHHQPEIGFELGRILGTIIREQHENFSGDVIIPIPLHRRRQMARGYNQSFCIAQGIAGELGITVREDLLKRTRATQTQTRKSRFERWLNVREAFRVMDASFISGRDIILVDDVVTTGSTLEACGRACLEAGARTITVICLASAR